MNHVVSHLCKCKHFYVVMKMNSILIFIYSYAVILNLSSSQTTQSATRRVNCPFPGTGIIDNSIDAYQLTYATYNEELELPCCQRFRTYTGNRWFVRSRYLLDDRSPFDKYESHFWNNVTEVWRIAGANADSAKAYYCSRGESPDIDQSTFVYFINIENPNRTVIEGGLEAFVKYKKEFLNPVSIYLRRNQEQPLQNLLIRTKLGVKVDLRWGQWSECDPREGVKIRNGRCRLSPYILDLEQCDNSCKMFNKTFEVDCSMYWSIRELSPILAEKVKNIPDFRLRAMCKGFEPESRKKMRTRLLRLGESVTIGCPHYTQGQNCYWRRNGLRMTSDDYDPQKKVTVNEFCTLYIRQATAKETGDFSCYLNNTLVEQNLIVVEKNSQYESDAWWRHIKYLIYIVFWCSIVLMGGIAVGCYQLNNFKTLDRKTVLKEYSGQRFEYEKLIPQENESKDD